MSDTEYESLPLEESLYNPSPDDIVLLKKLTGIENEDELKKHALEIQAQAYAVSHLCVFDMDYDSVLTFGRYIRILASVHSALHRKLQNLGKISHINGGFSLRFKISRYPFYQEILKIGKERPGAVYLELGCCCTSPPAPTSDLPPYRVF